MVYEYLYILTFYMPSNLPGVFFQNTTNKVKDSIDRRKIRLIESMAKCRYLKKWTCKKDFTAGVLSV
jgi:hypothetical protein